MIVTMEDGKKYVKADRLVVFGNNPKAWSQQLEDYINSKIRKGEDVHLFAEDGDILTLTAETAGKVASMYDSYGRTMPTETFERKVNAGSHIDELAKISERGKVIERDQNGRHGVAAEKGWNYRTAYFQDFDGTYYKTSISVMQGKDGNTVYNVGKMEERSIPSAVGSSAKGGAHKGNTSLTSSVPNSAEKVKGRFSLETADDQDIRYDLTGEEARKAPDPGHPNTLVTKGLFKSDQEVQLYA